VREIKVMEEHIKTNWFNKHEAFVTRYDGITILDWREPGTVIYSVRYIFAGSNLYISGDIGDAVFNLTWKATPESFDGVDLGYFLGKLSCHSRERWHFDERKAENDLREWYEEFSYDAGEKYLKEINEVKENIGKIIEKCKYSKRIRNATI
jgi:hypothetical protein